MSAYVAPTPLEAVGPSYTDQAGRLWFVALGRHDEGWRIWREQPRVVPRVIRRTAAGPAIDGRCALMECEVRRVRLPFAVRTLSTVLRHLDYLAGLRGWTPAEDH